MQSTQPIAGHQLPQKPPPSDSVVAIRAWALMGNRLEWNAVPIVAAVFGVDDVELFIWHLSVIRDSLNG